MQDAAGSEVALIKRVKKQHEVFREIICGVSDPESH